MIEIQRDTEELSNNMATVWVASEQLTSRLKQCEKRKKNGK